MRRVAAHGGPCVRAHAWRPRSGAHRLRTTGLPHRERVTTMDGSKPGCGTAQGIGEVGSGKPHGTASGKFPEASPSPAKAASDTGMTPSGKFPQGSQGQAGDQVAAAVGVSGWSGKSGFLPLHGVDPQIPSDPSPRAARARSVLCRGLWAIHDCTPRAKKAPRHRRLLYSCIFRQTRPLGARLIAAMREEGDVKGAAEPVKYLIAAEDGGLSK
jgi:hypothetical protein